MGGNEFECGREISDDHHPGDHRRHRTAHAGIDVDHIGGPDRTAGQRAGAGCGRNGPVTQHDGRPPAVGFLEGGQRVAGRPRVLRGQRVRGGAQHGGHGRFMPGPHLDQTRDRTEKSCASVVFL